MSDTGMARLSIRDHVIDTEDDDPNLGVVVWNPPEMTIADWEFQTEENQTTAAETNLEYPADSSLVIVAFKEDLDDHWEGWRDADAHTLFDGVCENGMHHYGFPKGRLARAESEPSDDSEHGERSEADPEEAMPEAFPDIAQRLEQNEFAVAYDPAEEVLRVEKFGIEHAIEHDGTIRGDSGIKRRVSMIVDRFL